MSFCVLGENCSVYDRHSKISGVALYNPLCEGCRNRSRSELNLLRYDYVDLSQRIPKADGHSEVKISRPKPESSPPLDVGVLTLRSDIAWRCVDAEVRLRARRGDLRSYAPVREGYGLDAAVSYLECRVEELAMLPAVDDLPSGVELLVLFGQLHRQARRVCGLEPRTIGVPGDCPHCLVASLRRREDDPERIWCAGCAKQFTKDGYHAALRMQFAPSPPPA